MATKKTSSKKSAAKKSRPVAKKKASVKKTSVKKASVKKSSAPKSSKPSRSGRTVSSSVEESRSLLDAVASNRDGSGVSDYSSPSFSSTGGMVEEEKRKGLPAIAIILGVVLVVAVVFFWRNVKKGGSEEATQETSQQATMQSQGSTETQAVDNGPSETTETDTASASEEGRVYVVKKGDSLYNIAQKHLGKGSRYKEIVDLNKDLLPRGAASMKTGMKLKLPAK